MTVSKRPIDSDLWEMKNRFDYDKDTGALYSILKNGESRNLVGNRVRYVTAKFKGRVYMAHVICWYLHYGEWPSAEIDHINRNGRDNRICNLRLATRSQNNQNLDRRRSSLFCGVSPAKRGTWRYCITNGSEKYEKHGFSSQLEAAIYREIHLDQLGHIYAKRNFLF